MNKGSICKRQLSNIATWMTRDETTNLPEPLQGIFFMDENPLPDDCLTLYRSVWDASNQTLFLPLFAPEQWTFHASISGVMLLRFVQWTQFAYEFHFEDETWMKAQIIPKLWGLSIPKWIVDFSMYQEGENNNGEMWQRQSSLLGGLIRLRTYPLRKIVDKTGQYTSAFADMLSKVENDCLAIVEE